MICIYIYRLDSDSDHPMIDYENWGYQSNSNIHGKHNDQPSNFGVGYNAANMSAYLKCNRWYSIIVWQLVGNMMYICVCVCLDGAVVVGKLEW